MASLEELETTWSLDDGLRASAILDAEEAAKAHEQAKADKKRRTDKARGK